MLKLYTIMLWRLKTHTSISYLKHQKYILFRIKFLKHDIYSFVMTILVSELNSNCTIT